MALSLSGITSAAKDLVTKLIQSGGNVGLVLGQTAGQTETGQPQNPPGTPNLGLKPSSVNTLTTEATHPAATADVFHVGDLFSGVNDFLNYIAWILHPLNWLRMVEFIIGMFFSMIGIALLARRGVGGVTARRVVSLTPGGRVIQGRMRGRREAQTQRAVNEGREQWKASHPK